MDWAAVGAAAWSIAFITALAYGARRAAARTGQPPILGELVLGALLSVPLLAAVHPVLPMAVYPPGAAAWLDAAAWVGLAFFMFLVGGEARQRAAHLATVAWTAAGGLLVPLIAGLAIFLAAPAWFHPEATLATGVLVAVVLTVSALPVLARILHDLQLHTHDLAPLLLAAAVVDDLAAWLLLALLAAAGHVGLTGRLDANLALVAGAFLLLIAATRRGASSRIARHGPGPAGLGLLVLGILGAAWFTHEAGLHAFLGPLAAGFAIGAWPAWRDRFDRVIGPAVRIVLLPVFFVVTMARIDLPALAEGTAVVALGILVTAAVAAKGAGTYLGARAAGMGHDAALASGILLNARGAVGLVVAQVGLDAGLVSTRGFSLLVATVLVTTLMAPVVARWHLGRFAGARPPTGA